MKLHTDTDLADMLGITVADVHNGCRNKGWPRVKPKRGIWRFTDGMVEQIIAMSSAPAKAPAKKASTGQSGRSKRAAS